MTLDIIRSLRSPLASGFVLLSLLFITACGRLEVSADPVVYKSALWIEAVERGEMLVQASGLGNLRKTDDGHFEAQLLMPGWALKKVEAGQMASTNTRKGIVSGKVIRKYPMKDNGVFQVDISLEGNLPDGLQNGMPVEGFVHLGRIDYTLFVRPPSFAPPNSKVSIFKVAEDGNTATRVQVEFGESSVNTIQVLNGLQAGDQIIISDMSAYDAFNSIKLN
jgi:HlyD family secretion protein